MRILFATFGSLGDLHPVMALGLELRRRGHDAAIVTSEYHRDRITAAGLPFFPAVPDLRPDDKALIRATMDERRGPEAVFRFMLADLAGTYDDCLRAIEAHRADLVVTSELAYAAVMAAEKSGARWASITLSPLSFLSAYDETVLPPAPWLRHVHALGPRVYGAVLGLARLGGRRLAAPITAFRRARGLKPVPDPLFDGKHSSELVLAMFSPLIGAPRPDWPDETVVTGYAFYDGDEPSLDAAIEAFLEDGPPPIVFTLGSAAVFDPGPFFDESVKAALLLRRRAILLVGPQPENAPLANETVGVFAYAPFSKLFPRACAIVHQGGSGTTGQAMRAGRPMLVVPYAHDQPDNALRARKLGIAASVRRERYNARTASQALAPLLQNRRVAQRAGEIAAIIAHENGAGAAADAIEEAFGG